jgi:hypothetical protein
MSRLLFTENSGVYIRSVSNDYRGTRKLTSLLHCKQNPARSRRSINVTINGVSNILLLPLDASAPKQLTDFKTDQIFWFDFSRDGKQLAVSRGIQTSDVILIRDFR